MNRLNFFKKIGGLVLSLPFISIFVPKAKADKESYNLSDKINIDATLKTNDEIVSSLYIIACYVHNRRLDVIAACFSRLYQELDEKGFKPHEVRIRMYHENCSLGCCPKYLS